MSSETIFTTGIRAADLEELIALYTANDAVASWSAADDGSFTVVAVLPPSDRARRAANPPSPAAHTRTRLKSL